MARRQRQPASTAKVATAPLVVLLVLLSSSFLWISHAETTTFRKQRYGAFRQHRGRELRPNLSSVSVVPTSASLLTHTLSVSRGGGREQLSDDYEEDSALTSDDDADPDTVKEILAVSWSAFKSTFKAVRKVAGVAANAVSRSLNAGLFEEDEEDRDLPTLTRVGKALGRMASALFATPRTETGDGEKADVKLDKPKPKKKKKKTPTEATTTSAKTTDISTKKKRKKKAKKSATPAKAKVQEESTTETPVEEKTSVQETPQPETPADEDEVMSEPQNEDDIVEEVNETVLSEAKEEPEKPAKQSAVETPSTPAELTAYPPETTRSPVDYGIYLEKAYKVDGSRGSLEDPCVVHTGSFSDALVAARSQARLLLVLIPSQKPPSRNEADQKALKAFLSEDVSNMANRPARKNSASGSFYLWSALPGSPEAALAMRRLKVSASNPNNKKRPILVVAYVGHAVDSYGRTQYGAKVLAQHHANPPPAAGMMAAWMNALRKRHAAQYVKMQKEMAEAQYFKERREGYHSSMRTDTENRQKEAQKAKEEAARQEAEKQRQAAVVQRRVQLKEDLPEEPAASSKDVKTIALRLSNGETLRRRFTADTSLATVFNWVDVTLEQERETAVLTSLNGKLQFSWTSSSRESTLEELGLSKMTAFRVTQAEEKEASGNEVDDDKENEKNE